MQIPGAISFWLKQFSRQTELSKIFADSAKVRVELWKKALPFIKLSPADRKNLKNWEEKIQKETNLNLKIITKFLNLLFVAREWTLAGGALDLLASEIFFKNLKPTDHARLWKSIAKITNIHKKNNFIWLENDHTTTDAWRKFFIKSQASQYQNFSDKNYAKLVEHLNIIDQTLAEREKSLSFLKFFEAHAPELSSEQLHILSDKLDLFENVAKYLINIPEGDNYSDLRFHQNLVIKHFQPEKLILTPEKSEGPLLGAFWEYKSIYTERYLSDHEKYYKEARAYLKTAEQREKKLKALKNLDAVKELGEPCYEKFAKLQKEFDCTRTSCSFEESEKLLKILENNSSHCPECGFRIGQAFPIKKFEKYEKDLSQIINDKIGNLRAKGIEEIMRDDHSNTIRKLIELIHLADFDKIVDLLASDKTNQISKALQKIFKK